MQKITGFFTELMRKYLPDPFVFAIGLTLLTMVLAVLVQGQGIVALTTSWGKGFWTLLAFTTQMAVILAMGYVLATAPLTERFLDRIVMRVHDPRTAIIVATLVGGIGSYLNWGFGLVIGGIVARKLALSVKGVHYPLIIASAYSGFTLYGLGLSASIPVLISTKGHPMEAQMGVIPLSETIFSPTMLITSLVVLITLPLLNAWLHPKPGQPVTEIDRTLEENSRAAKPALPADVSCERDSLPIGKRPSLASDLHRDRRTIGGADAEHAHCLEVAPAIARRLDAPGTQMILDVRRGQTDAGGEHGAALELVGRDIGEPFLQVLSLDGRDVPARRRASAEDAQSKSQGDDSRPGAEGK